MKDFFKQDMTIGNYFGLRLPHLTASARSDRRYLGSMSRSDGSGLRPLEVTKVRATAVLMSFFFIVVDRTVNRFPDQSSPFEKTGDCAIL